LRLVSRRAHLSSSAILYRFGVRAVLWGKEHDPRYEFHRVFDSLSSHPAAPLYPRRPGAPQVSAARVALVYGWETTAAASRFMTRPTTRGSRVNGCAR